MSDNNVKVSDETWRRLNARKEPGDSFDDVIDRLLEEHGSGIDGAVAES